MSLKTEQPRHSVVKTEQPRHSVVKTEQPRHSVVKTEQPRPSVVKTEQPHHSVVKTEGEVSVLYAHTVFMLHMHTQLLQSKVVLLTTVVFPLHSVTESD